MGRKVLRVTKLPVVIRTRVVEPFGYIHVMGSVFSFSRKWGIGPNTLYSVAKIIPFVSIGGQNPEGGLFGLPPAYMLSSRL